MGGPDMMGRRGMMGRGMMGRGGMMGAGSMHSGMMMRMLFALMDSDGDGTFTLQEFQAAHEWIFKAMDANKDGRLTLDEMQAFVHGPPASSIDCNAGSRGNCSIRPPKKTASSQRG